MKKVYNLNYADNNYLLIDPSNHNNVVFKIDADTLEFDTVKFYEALFDGISEYIEISIEYSIKEDTLNEVLAKNAKHIHKTISELTSEICKKINTECFKDPIKE